MIFPLYIYWLLWCGVNLPKYQKYTVQVLGATRIFLLCTTEIIIDQEGARPFQGGGGGLQPLHPPKKTLGRGTRVANSQSQDRSFICECGRVFRRQGDLTRHKHFCGFKSYRRCHSPGFPRALLSQFLQSMGSFKVQGLCVCVSTSNMDNFYWRKVLNVNGLYINGYRKNEVVGALETNNFMFH